MKIKPLYDKIVVEPIEEQSETAYGIIIPDSAKEKPKKGKVIAKGPGNYNNRGELIPLSVAENDIVFFPKTVGNETKLNGKNYLIMKESDIIGIIEE